MEKNFRANVFCCILLLVAILCNKAVAADPQIIRGPYLQNATGTSIVIMWETDIASTGTCLFGETVAIVGATGAGKSTIINLLNRFYEINSGEITIDGVDIKEYKLASLRSHIAVVLQDVFLFADTIANNISLKSATISVDDIENAAKAIGVDEFISSLPGGYEYNVKERGTMLSSGQRQLIAFLRAYVSNPSILILDEATSSLDTETEALLHEAMHAFLQNRTTLIIAHRLSAVRQADRVLVFDAGKIIDEGHHHELISKDGLYRDLYSTKS